MEMNRRFSRDGIRPPRQSNTRWFLISWRTTKKNAKLPFTIATNLFNRWISVRERQRRDERGFFFRFFLALTEYRRNKNEPKLEFQEDKIVIASYANLVSLIYNQNHLGFNRDRNGVQW